MRLMLSCSHFLTTKRILLDIKGYNTEDFHEDTYSRTLVAVIFHAR